MVPSPLLKMVGLIKQLTCNLTITEFLFMSDGVLGLVFDKKEKCLWSHEAYVLVGKKDSNIK